MKIKIKLSTFFTFLLIATFANAGLREEIVHYQADETEMHGYLVWDDRYPDKRPGIIIVHEWWGLNDYVKARARQLALMGYSAFAIDMYGAGQNTAHPKIAKQFSSAVYQNLDGAKSRFQKAMAILSKHQSVTNDTLSAIGYCFGGSIVLEMARLGLPLKMVASFHGGLKPHTNNTPNITSKVLVFNGSDDKIVPKTQRESFVNEMERYDVDYEFYNYNNTVHAFSNPEASSIGVRLNISNLRYSRHADSDSWAKLSQTLSDLYAK